MQVEKGPALTKALTEMMLDVGNPLFAFGVMADLMDSNTNAFYLEQSGLGMGNRDYYLEESNAALKKGYEELLAKLFVLSGTEEAEAKRAAADVVAFETELARASWSNVELRDIARSYNPMSVADLKKRYDAIDWEVLFDDWARYRSRDRPCHRRTAEFLRGDEQTGQTDPDRDAALLPGRSIPHQRGILPERRLLCRFVRLLRPSDGRQGGASVPAGNAPCRSPTRCWARP